MFFFGGVFGIAILVFWIWAIFDVITSDAERCRNLPKVAWVLIVILLGALGALVWIFGGRPARAAAGPEDGPRRGPTARPVGPEDRPGWTSAPSTSPSSRDRSEELDRRLAEWEAEQRRRDAGDDPEPPPA
jgi:hypothetical protein